MSAVPSSPSPVAPDRLPELLAELIAGTGGRRLSVAIDGAPAAEPGVLADAIGACLRAKGRPVARVRAAGFLRAASVRLERGRQDPSTYRSGWLDAGALRREVLEPFRSRGAYLPSLWDADRDRATRAAVVQAAPGAILVLDGTLLLDKDLPFDLIVHLCLSAAALARRTESGLQWTLPAYAGYRGEESADVVVRCDDVRHPAISVREPVRSPE